MADKSYDVTNIKTEQKWKKKVNFLDLKILTFHSIFGCFSDHEEDNESPDDMVLEGDSESEEDGELEELFPVPNLQGKV